MVYKVLNLFQQIFSPITVQVSVTARSCLGTLHKQDPLYERDLLYFFRAASCEVGHSLIVLQRTMGSQEEPGLEIAQVNN